MILQFIIVSVFLGPTFDSEAIFSKHRSIKSKYHYQPRFLIGAMLTTTYFLLELEKISPRLRFLIIVYSRFISFPGKYVRILLYSLNIDITKNWVLDNYHRLESIYRLNKAHEYINSGRSEVLNVQANKRMHLIECKALPCLMTWKNSLKRNS